MDCLSRVLNDVSLHDFIRTTLDWVAVLWGTLIATADRSLERGR